MLSLKELEATDCLRKVKAVLIDLNERSNSYVAELAKVNKMIQQSTIEIEALTKKLEFEVVPQAKLRAFEKHAALAERCKLAKSEIAELVYLDPEVSAIRKRLDTYTRSVADLKIQKDTLWTEYQALRDTWMRVESISKTEGLLAKINYGLTRVNVKNYFGDRDGLEQDPHEIA